LDFAIVTLLLVDRAGLRRAAVRQNWLKAPLASIHDAPQHSLGAATDRGQAIRTAPAMDGMFTK
jgi:hypothetical protein